MAKKALVLEGGDELERKLKACTEAVAGAALADATLTGAGPMLARMNELVPVRRGNLQASLAAEVVASDKYHADVAVGSFGDPVAHLVEDGHAIVVGGPLGKGGKAVGVVPPHPFIRPAYDTQKAAAVEALGDELRKDLEAVAR